jgi:hypothetical protein
MSAKKMPQEPSSTPDTPVNGSAIAHATDLDIETIPHRPGFCLAHSNKKKSSGRTGRAPG